MNFIKINSSTGGLRVREYAASQAVPISGLKVVVTTTIENNKKKSIVKKIFPQDFRLSCRLSRE